MLRFNSPEVSKMVNILANAIRNVPTFSVGFIPDGAEVDVYYHRNQLPNGAYDYRLYRCLLANGGYDVTPIILQMPDPTTKRHFISNYDLGEYMHFCGKVAINLETFSRLVMLSMTKTKRISLEKRWQFVEYLLLDILQKRKPIPTDMTLFLDNYDKVSDPAADSFLKRMIKRNVIIYDNPYSLNPLKEMKHTPLPTTSPEELVTSIYSFLTCPFANYGNSVFYCEGLPYDRKEVLHTVNKKMVDLYLVSAAASKTFTIPTHVSVPPTEEAISIRQMKIGDKQRKVLRFYIPYSPSSALNSLGDGRHTSLKVNKGDYIICAKSEFVSEFIFIGMVRMKLN